MEQPSTPPPLPTSPATHATPAATHRNNLKSPRQVSVTRVGAEVTRGDAALWQSRVREAVAMWEAVDGGAFTLR